MAIALTATNKEKLDRLALAKNMSQNDLVNLLVAAVDEIELAEMLTERAKTGKARPRAVRIQARASWQIRP